MNNIKTTIAVTIGIYLTICVSAAHADSYLECVSNAYKHLQLKKINAFGITEKQLLRKSPSLVQVFHPQVEKIQTIVRLDIISFNYFVKKYPNKMKKYYQKNPLTLASLAPRWNVMINGDNNVFNELIKDKEFKKHFEYLELLEKKLLNVQDSELFKKAEDTYYSLFIAEAKSEKLKERSMIKVQELGCS